MADKLVKPEMIAHLAGRVQARQAAAKKAWAGASLGLGSAVAVVMTIALMGSVPAHAQGIFYTPAPPPAVVKPVKTKPPIAPPTMRAGLFSLTGNTAPSGQTGIDALFAKIQQASIADLTFALYLAKSAACSTADTTGCPNPAPTGFVVPAPSAQTTAADVTAQCYASILQVLSTTSSVQAAVAGQASSTGAPAAPTGLATAFTKFEQLRQVSVALQPTSALQVACAPLAQQIRLNTLQLVTGILSGGLGLAQLGVVP